MPVTITPIFGQRRAERLKQYAAYTLASAGVWVAVSSIYTVSHILAWAGADAFRNPYQSAIWLISAGLIVVAVVAAYQFNRRVDCEKKLEETQTQLYDLLRSRPGVVREQVAVETPAAPQAQIKSLRDMPDDKYQSVTVLPDGSSIVELVTKQGETIERLAKELAAMNRTKIGF